ncbi:MAG: hypothetical protein ABFC98_02010 [Candidatus Cloacimonas sp.]
MVSRWLKLLIVILLVCVFSSCDLKRSNPLDPNGDGDVIIPEPVTGITYHANSLNQTPCFVTLTWQANNPYNTDGYYVYRGLGYNSSFELVGDVSINEFTHSSTNDLTVLPGYYWYRVSAYKIYPEGKLEGRRSEPMSVYIP